MEKADNDAGREAASVLALRWGIKATQCIVGKLLKRF